MKCIAKQKDKITLVHKEQIQAYQQAAKQALLEYAKTVTLPDETREATSQPQYVQHCVRTVLEQAPNWKVTRPVMVALCQKIITERAQQAYRAAHPEVDDDSKPAGTKSQGTEEGEEVESNEHVAGDEEGAEEEEGEEAEDEELEEGEEEEGDAGPVPAEDEARPEEPAEKKLAQKRKGILAKKRAAAKAAGKAATRKKTEKVKSPAPKPGRGGNRRQARRGGRGGGNSK